MKRTIRHTLFAGLACVVPALVAWGPGEEDAGSQSALPHESAEQRTVMRLPNPQQTMMTQQAESATGEYATAAYDHDGGSARQQSFVNQHPVLRYAEKPEVQLDQPDALVHRAQDENQRMHFERVREPGSLSRPVIELARAPSVRPDPSLEDGDGHGREMGLRQPTTLQPEEPQIAQRQETTPQGDSAEQTASVANEQRQAPTNSAVAQGRAAPQPARVARSEADANDDQAHDSRADTREPTDSYLAMVRFAKQKEQPQPTRPDENENEVEQEFQPQAPARAPHPARLAEERRPQVRQPARRPDLARQYGYPSEYRPGPSRHVPARYRQRFEPTLPVEYAPGYHDHYSYERDARYEPSVFRFADSQTDIPEPATDVDYSYGYGCGHGHGLVVVGGLESTFLFPVMEAGPASVRIEENGGADPLYTSGEVRLDDKLFFSPRLYGGIEHCGTGWGVIGRLFFLDGSESAFTPESPFLPQNHKADSRLEAYTLDAEIYKKWCTEHCDNRYAAIGFRYANWEAAESVEAHATVGGDFVQGLAHTERLFDGPGVTFAFGGDRASCHCCHICWFFNFRGSVMWGTVRKSAQTTAWAFDPAILPGTAVNFSTAVSETDDIAFIGEVQAGLKWEHPLACCCARAVVRAAVEYQYWNADGGFAAAGSNAFTNGAIVTSLATADDFEMNLVGFTVGTGLVW